MANLFKEVCSLLAKMSNNCNRPISVWRLANRQTITINVYYEKTGMWFCLSRGPILDSICLYLYPQSQKFKCYIVKHFPRKDLYQKFLPRENQYYSSQNVEPGSNAQRILNFFLKLLTDPGLVRVDPYDREKILTGEETDADQLLAINCAAVEAFEQGLESIELKPGIINPDDAPRVNN